MNGMSSKINTIIVNLNKYIKEIYEIEILYNYKNKNKKEVVEQKDTPESNELVIKQAIQLESQVVLDINYLAQKGNKILIKYCQVHKH